MVERLLGSVEDYNDWNLEEKVLYHEFVIEEITALLG